MTHEARPVSSTSAVTYPLPSSGMLGDTAPLVGTAGTPGTLSRVALDAVFFRSACRLTVDRANDRSSFFSPCRCTRRAIALCNASTYVSYLKISEWMYRDFAVQFSRALMAFFEPGEYCC